MLEAYKKMWLDGLDFKGRMKRGDYGKAMLMYLLVAFIPEMVIAAFEWYNPVVYIYLTFCIISSVVALSATVRRFHDAGKSVWWLLLCIVLSSSCGIGMILFFIIVCTNSDGDNKWGNVIQELQSESFVDERLTEEDIKNDRKKIFFVVLKIIGILILIYVAKELLTYLFIFVEELFF